MLCPTKPRAGISAGNSFGEFALQARFIGRTVGSDFGEFIEMTARNPVTI
jgi:hypothetical protein